MKKNSNFKMFFCFLWVPLIVFGCADSHKTDEYKPQSNQQPLNSAPTKQEPVIELTKPDRCDSLKMRLNHNRVHRVDSQQDFTIERHFQRVIRKNCAGAVKSDRIETVLPPHADIRLENILKKQFKSVFVFNEDSCDQSLTSMPIWNLPLLGLIFPITGDGKKSILIKGDLAPALFTFRLSEGLNHIFVEYFYDCSPSQVEGSHRAYVGVANCEQAKSSAIVEYPIFISYEEKTLNGFKEVIPSAEECKDNLQ